MIRIKSFVLFGTILGAASLYAIQAQAKTTLTLAAYGGSYEKVLEHDILPAFEKKHDIDITYVPGNSTDTLAKLQAERGHEQIDLAIMDDGPTYQAINYGLCQSLAGDPALSKVYGFARFPDDKGVGFGIVAGLLVYNKAVFKEKGWAPPKSWNALKDPRYAGHLLIPSITNSYGVYALVMTARLNGGGEKNIEPGFKVFEQSIAPNVLSFTPSPGKTSQLFQSNQVWLAVWGSSRAHSLAETGFPVGVVYPKEGAVALVDGACVVKGSDHAKLAREFTNYLLTPSVQKKLAVKKGNGPANKTVKLPPKVAAKVPYGKRAKNLVKMDWTTINKKRQQWTQMWNRRVER
jgi:putative spermidine/putrescine transport system substrate-binding protein